MKHTADEIIRLLAMEEHYEGGYYAFRWKSDRGIPRSSLPEPYAGDRKTVSLIFYLLKAGQVSRWHRLLSDEIWFWHAGGTLEMSLGGSGPNPEVRETVLIGEALERGESLQAPVPGGVWQTTRVVSGDFVLVSCAVSPGFEVEDFFLPDPGLGGTV